MVVNSHLVWGDPLLSRQTTNILKWVTRGALPQHTPLASSGLSQLVRNSKARLASQASLTAALSITHT